MRRLHVSAYDDQVLAALYSLAGMATCREVCEALVCPGRFVSYGDVYASLRRMELDRVVRREWYENSQLVFWEAVEPAIPAMSLEALFRA